MAEELDLGTLEIDAVDAIGNGDIINLTSLIDQGLRQFGRCPSASTADTHPQDVAIAESWIAFFEQRFEHFAGNPELYMPRAHPKPKKLPASPVIKIVENSSLQNLMYSMVELRTELLYCNDAERSNGFREQTAQVVVRPWIVKFKAFVGLMRTNLDNDAISWFPDVDLQEPGLNAGEPR